MGGREIQRRGEPPYDAPELERAERNVAKDVPVQMPLFGAGVPQETSVTALAEPGSALTRTSSLTVAREHYRAHLQAIRHPKTTVDSYSYDLARFNDLTGPRAINQIRQGDIAAFLGRAANRSTRKRRLTTLRGFFRYLIEDQQVLGWDPTEGFHPQLVPLRQPDVLTPNQQDAIISAADGDEPWSGLAVRLMLRLGLSRGEILQLDTEHVTEGQGGDLVVNIEYDESVKRLKGRRLAGGGDLLDAYRTHLERMGAVDTLVPVGPQAVNSMVTRVAKRAGIEMKVTPHTLRHTFAYRHAQAGASADDLIKLLGLIDDPRNRASVARYLEMVAGPLRADLPKPAVEAEASSE
jgi:integrase/recombinase XerD